MSKRSGLGKGLEALIPTDQEPAGGVAQVPVAAIAPNPMQPRTAMDPEALAELAESIREHGLIQPLIVTRQGPEQYQLIAGERRLQAARLAGLGSVPAIVKEATPQEVLELALVENIQRADLNPLEEASAFRHLVDEFGLTQEQVARRVGKSRVAVTNTLRLLRLPDEVREALAGGTIHEGHARALLALPTPEAQLAALKVVVQKDLSVRQTEELVRRLLAEPPQPRPQEDPGPEAQALEQEFRDTLGTKVNLYRNRKGRGRLVIHFYSEEELQAIYDLIVGGA
ncbi:MAG: ParB/RepB/Spo0J family partition protein [Anaerolineaceae bacterium]|mgnify:CR=1 FL=1|jgi:ParB family chromosome partitioning protein|nr:ParB/RepB/Spo0J family partition protein [Anaerolineae bacterium]MDX9832912.1 ParB/RepB/Spo0J family partition protein [Anaerolineae bacterium]NLF12884.1 ParB/RepB/Spo0J family partition protein [Anaerolineaceae bacterium]